MARQRAPACPSCTAPVPLEAPACPHCGEFFGEEDERGVLVACPTCGEQVKAEHLRLHHERVHAEALEKRLRLGGLQRRRRRTIAAGALVGVLAVTALFVVLTVAGGGEGPPTGQSPLPFFSFVDSAGVPFTTEGYRGRVLLLDLMATRCITCERSAPTLVDLQTHYAGAQFALVSISVASYVQVFGVDTDADLEAFRTTYNATWRFALDTDGIGEFFRVTSLPTFVLIGPDGVQAAKFSGDPGLSGFVALIDPLIP